MAETPQGSRWADVVAALDAVVGAVLLIAGAYLIEPGVLDLGLYVEAERYVLAGAALIFCGLVLAYAGVFGLAPPRKGVLPEIVSAVFGTLGRFCVAAMMLMFALRASVAEMPAAWSLLPLIPGVLAFLSLWFARVAKARVKNPPADHSITSETGKTEPLVVRSFVRFALIFVVTLSAGIFVLGGAAGAYVLLDRAFIGGEPIRLGFAIPAISRTLVPIVLMLAEVVLVGLVVVGALRWAGDSARRRRQPDVERNLTADEISFATACVQRVRAYVTEHDLGALTRRATAASFWLVVALGGLGAALLVEADRLVAAAYGPAGDGWHLYLIEWPGAGAIVFMSLVSLALVPHAIAKVVWPRVAEASGASMLQADRAAGALEAQIVKRVRDRSLLPGEPFDAAELMRTWGITTAAIALVWNVLLLAGVALWWPHDRARDTLYTEDGIETGDFWTMERDIYRYDAVQAVHLTCDGDAIGYAVLLPEDLRREVLMRLRLSTRLDDAVKIDGKLRVARVPFAFAFPEEAGSSELGVVDRMCILKLTRGMDDASRAKVEQLFHLDEWFERRWLLRTGGRPQISSR